MKTTILLGAFLIVALVVSPITGAWIERDDKGRIPEVKEKDKEGDDYNWDDSDYSDSSEEKFIPAPKAEKTPLANIQIYKDASFQGRTTNILLEQGKCRNVAPDFKNKISSIDYGYACIIIYQQSDCAGHSAELTPENAFNSEDLSRIGMARKVSSVQLC